MRSHTAMPTTRAATVEPIHRSCIRWASSVMPSGHPQLSQLPRTSHPLSVSAPRRPSPATCASLLRRATARCLLIPRVAAPRGLTGGASSVARQVLPTPTTVSPRLADPACRPGGGRSTPAGRPRPGGSACRQVAVRPGGWACGGRRTGRHGAGRRHPPRAGGYSRGVYRRLLTWRWVLLHLLVLALFVATFFLGHWQLGKADAGGGVVNWSYALQWPLYG